MNTVRSTTRLAALAVVTLVGASACALDPQAEPAGEAMVRVSAAEWSTGASAALGPDQRTTSTTSTTTTGTTTAGVTTAPALATTTTTTTTTLAAATSCPTGEYQRAVETYLNKLGKFGRLTVDGKQSAADCTAIKLFQQRYDIRPVQGRAGPTTYDVAKRLATTNVSDCRAGSGVTFCIDLTKQTTWVMRNGSVVVPPTVTRTGMKGYATPAGTYRINFRNVKEWSDPYEVWLPYWQRFVGGIGYHQTTTYLHDKSIGSHGCINLLPSDARWFWDWGKVGYRVVVFGRRPGT